MAFRTWVKLLSATLGVGALAGASQLGVAYGLGIVRLTRVLDVTARDQWTAQLAWVAWFAMMAAVVGALAGSWMLPRWSPTRPGSGTIVAISVAAGIGAAVVVPLTMQPARTAQIVGVHPVFVIGVCAGLGALAGVFAAAAALVQPVSRWNLSALGIAVWVIAIVSVSPSLAPDDPLPAVRLGVFDAGFLSPGVTQRTALFTMPALALIAGALLGWAARRQGRPTLTVALAGLPGPALLTVAYLIAGPGSGADRYQVVPYWAAMTATGAGVLGSVLAAVLRRGVPDDPADESGDAPAEERLPLPRRTGQTESAIARASAPPPEPDGGPGLTSTGVLDPIDGPGPRVSAPRGSDRPQDQAAGRPQTLSDTMPGGRGTNRPADPPGGRSGNRADGRASGPGYSPMARSGGVALGEHPGTDPFTSFSATATVAVFPTADPQPGPATRAGQHAAAEPQPYVPAPATRPLPPEALQAAQPEPASRNPNTRLGRTLRPFSRGRVDHPAEDLDLGRRPDRAARHGADTVADQHPEADAGGRKRRGWRRGKPADAVEDNGPATAPPAGRIEPVQAERPAPLFASAPIRDDRIPAGRPFAPEPQTISAPLPHPEPITGPITAPQPILPPAADDKRRGGKQRRPDDDYVDWVSGLGGE
jgi:hypothetical protein